jgi:hypothetical protein
LAIVELLLVEQREGVMIAGVPAEEACAGWFRDKKTEQIEIEMFACLQVRCIETKVAKPPYLERAVQGNAADVILVYSRYRHSNFLPNAENADTIAYGDTASSEKLCDRTYSLLYFVFYGCKRFCILGYHRGNLPAFWQSGIPYGIGRKL